MSCCSPGCKYARAGFLLRRGPISPRNSSPRTPPSTPCSIQRYRRTFGGTALQCPAQHMMRHTGPDRRRIRIRSQCVGTLLRTEICFSCGGGAVERAWGPAKILAAKPAVKFPRVCRGEPHPVCSVMRAPGGLDHGICIRHR